MPSELMDLHGLPPSSFLSEEVGLPNERQIGFWKKDGMPDNYGLKADGKVYAVGDNSLASLPLEQQIAASDPHMLKRFDVPNLNPNQEQKVHIRAENNAVGAGRMASHLRRPLDSDVGNTSYLMAGNKFNVMGDHYENGLFSSSLSELFTRKLRLSANNTSYGHSVGAAASHYEEEPFESIEEIEAQTIGNLLPDDDELLSGVNDRLDYAVRPGSGDDVEEVDFFSSVGGLELGEEGGQKNYYDISGAAVLGEHPHGEHPSRTLSVRNINSNVEDSEIQILFEQYGDVRTLYTACKHHGFVMVSYYDIRAARNAMNALQGKPLRRRKLDIHYPIPKDNPSDKDTNHGTLVLNSLDSTLSNDELHQFFAVYGEVKEIRETTQGSHQKTVEFYDVRAAEAALRALNKGDIAGQQLKLEPGRLDGAKRLSRPFPELDLDETNALLQMCSPPTDFRRDISGPASHMRVTSGTMDNGNGSLLGGIIHPATGSPATQLLDAELQHAIHSSVSNAFPSGLLESGQLQNRLKYDLRNAPNYHPHSLPEYQDGLANTVFCNSPTTMTANMNTRMPERVENRQFSRIGASIEHNDNAFGPAGNSSGPPAAHHYMWNTQPQPHNMMWPNSPFIRAPSHMMNALVPVNSHHVGSAPSVWDRRQSYAAAAGESPETSMFGMRIPGNSPHHPLDFVSRNVFPRMVGGGSMDMPIPAKNGGLAAAASHHHQVFPGRGQMIPMMGSFDSPGDRARTRRNEGGSNQADNKKQFELDLDRIMRGEDKRTTLMIKNIPNKYTSKMLLAAIDERHRGTYDFIYLPIDFKNKCNVGYAFINMTDPSHIIPFYQAFNGKKWEKFNSEKVASLAYARIQGKAALIAHFQNSSLMNEDKRCRPILFHTDGPNAGDQVPFPMGVNVRSRPNKARGNTNEGEGSQDLASSNGDSSSGSTKDFE